MDSKYFFLVQDMTDVDVKIKEAVERCGHKPLFWKTKDYFQSDWVMNSHPDSIVLPSHTGTWIQRDFTDRKISNLSPWDRLRCRAYTSYWHKHLFNLGFEFWTLGSLTHWLETNDHNPFFLRPDECDKPFPGGVIYNKSEVYALTEALSKETLVLTSAVKEITAEWRVFMREGKYLTGSQYRLHGDSIRTTSCTDEVIAFAEEVAKEPYPGLPDLYVMDIAYSQPGDRYGLLEIGSVNCAGFYGADHDLLVEAIVEETVSEFEKNYGKDFPS